MVQKLTLEKMFLAKILIFLKEKKKKSIDFCHQKLTLYNFGTFDDLSFSNNFFFLFSILILGQKSCFLGPTIFEIPQPNWYYYTTLPLLPNNPCSRSWLRGCIRNTFKNSSISWMQRAYENHQVILRLTICTYYIWIEAATWWTYLPNLIRSNMGPSINDVGNFSGFLTHPFRMSAVF